MKVGDSEETSESPKEPAASDAGTINSKHGEERRSDEHSVADAERREDKDDITKLAEELAEQLGDFVNQVISGAQEDTPIDEKTNFTWFHFFTEKCGILPADARKYESSLIAHRMNPVDTLLESLGLIIEYGRIPIGDKLKITKTIKRAEDSIATEAKCREDAKNKLGLEEYSDFEASFILNNAGGREQYDIDFGIELLEDWRDLQRERAFTMIQNPQAAENYAKGAEVGMKMNDPVFELLRRFGYKTFDYTYGKTVEETSVPACATSVDPILESILFGNSSPAASEEESAVEESVRFMYS